MEEVKVLGTENGVLTIALSGDIDLGNAESFYTETLNAYQAAPSDITFDCKELNFIDSTTLGTFVKILKTLKAKKGSEIADGGVLGTSGLSAASARFPTKKTPCVS